MPKHLIVILFVLCVSLPAHAVECLGSANAKQPILVFGHVNVAIRGIDSSELEHALRERLVRGGKYQVLLPDQYQYAVKTKQLDRCSSAFMANVTVAMNNTDTGAGFGFAGFVTRSDFTASVHVEMMPDGVTLDEFVIKDRANTFIAGTAAMKAFQRLFENLALEFESRRDGWVRTKMPGMGAPLVSDDSGLPVPQR